MSLIYQIITKTYQSTLLATVLYTKSVDIYEKTYKLIINIPIHRYIGNQEAFTKE